MYLGQAGRRGTVKIWQCYWSRNLLHLKKGRGEMRGRKYIWLIPQSLISNFWIRVVFIKCCWHSLFPLVFSGAGCCCTQKVFSGFTPFSHLYPGCWCHKRLQDLMFSSSLSPNIWHSSFLLLVLFCFFNFHSCFHVSVKSSAANRSSRLLPSIKHDADISTHGWVISQFIITRHSTWWRSDVCILCGTCIIAATDFGWLVP